MVWVVVIPEHICKERVVKAETQMMITMKAPYPGTVGIIVYSSKKIIMCDNIPLLIVICFGMIRLYRVFLSHRLIIVIFGSLSGVSFGR